jgi:hypothetical protein
MNPGLLLRLPLKPDWLMGAAVPAAIGAKIAADGPVVVDIDVAVVELPALN